MKIRVKYKEIRKTVSCENGADTTLQDLKRIIATNFGYLADEAKDLELSLNGKDALEDDEKKLSEFGLVSWDLVFVLQDGRQSENIAQDDVSNSQTGSQPQTNSNSFREEDEVIVEDGRASTCEDVDMYDQEGITYDPTIVNSCLQEPLLCRESNETTVPAALQTLYTNTQCCQKTDALWVVIHTLMLEAGFTSVSQTAVQDKCRMPENWKPNNRYEIMYNHVELTPEATCKVVGVCLGSKLIIHGKIATSCESKDVQLKVDDFISTLEPEASSTYKNLPRLSILIKDNLALPLLQDLNTVLGLPPVFGLLGLNFELKMKISSYLDCVSLLRLGEVCKQLNSIYKDPYLWRALYLITFGASLKTDLSQDWYEMYKHKYKKRKEMKTKYTFKIPELLRPRPHPFPPFSPVFPHHGIIGGDYDLNPHFHGIPDPLSRRQNHPASSLMRPRYESLHPETDNMDGAANRRTSFPSGYPRFGPSMGKRFF